MYPTWMPIYISVCTLMFATMKFLECHPFHWFPSIFPLLMISLNCNNEHG